jgi:hypothetical protein
MRTTLLALITLLVLLLSGCVSADLGDAPLLCNEGLPRCPSGYVCKQIQTSVEHCLRDGYQPPGNGSSPVTSADGGVAESD